MQHWVRVSAKVAAGFLSALFLLLPVTANALGLGNIKMESALNQPLKAEIPLLSATSEEVKDLEVKLASREAFLRAGVDRSTLLSEIKFHITKRNSKYYVTLTTGQSVREPFLNFLVELNWKNGRMLREYTVLLDPAGSGQQQSQMSQAPETTPPEETPMPEPSAAAAEPEQPIPAPTSPFVAAPEGAANEPAPAPAEAGAAPEPEPMLLGPDTQQAETQKPQVAEAPAPVAAPEPQPEAAPEPEPMPMPSPEPAPTAAAPEPAPAESQPYESAQKQVDDGRLFPAIPLRAFKESQMAAEENAPAPAPEPAQMPEEAGAATPVPAGELDYGITKKGDNLWTIAERLKPNDQVTIYQVMMALQESNPKAFVNGNIHRLKVGQVMRIDDPSLLTSISKREAVGQYQAQTRDWENYLASVGREVPRQTIVAGEQPAASGGSGVPSGELTLASPQSEKMGAGTGGTDIASSEDAALLEQQARKAMQEAKTARKRNAELNSKLNDLEKELNNMENLVTVKNSDLAKLQRKLDELNAQRAQAGESNSTGTAPGPVPATTEATPAPEPAEEPSQPVAAAPPTTPPSGAEEETPAEPEAEQAPAPAAPPTAESPKPAEPAMPTAPPVAAPAPAPEPAAKPAAGGGIMGTISGIFSNLFGGLNAMMLIVIGVVIVIVLLLVFILIRRRKGADFQESILTGAGGEEDAMSLDSDASQGASLMGGESSFLSDFAISGVSAIQAEDSEVDPLTEADVFMAYGRYEAAEERLQEAIAQDPKRGELRVKLLELFNTTKDKQAFESAAEDFYAALEGNADSNPLWQKVVAMGRDLVPGNPLFSGGVAASAAAAASASAADEGHADVMDIGLDTGVFNTSDFSADSFNESESAPAVSEPAHTDSGMDFNLDLGEPEEAAPEAAESSDLDFSLDFGGETASSDAAEPDTGMDFNLDLGGDSTEQSAAGSADEMDMSFSLEGDDEPTATEIKMDDAGGNGAGDLDFDFAMDSSGGDADTGGISTDDSDSSVSLDSLGGGDEVGTKLDLARAYIDMGDPDGARSILDEVMEEGSDGQKQEAQQLITQIG